MDTTRRQAAIGLGLLAGFGGGTLGRPGGARAAGDVEAAFARIESEVGGRLGVAALDTGTGRRAAHRADERFPLCSTFKALAAGAILARVDAGQETLARRIRFAPDEVVTYSPVTKAQAGGEGMTVAAICEAAITMSDNTAGNLMLRTLGGPAGLTAFLRGIGDATSRLDRTETALNEAAPGDPRDTTTPSAMLADLDALVLGSVLSASSKRQLADWLVANTTGNTRLRAGMPTGWRVGDKTGAGDRGTTNDVAVVWPPGRAPLLVAAYLTDTETPAERRFAAIAAIAAVGRTVARAFA